MVHNATPVYRPLLAGSLLLLALAGCASVSDSPGYRATSVEQNRETPYGVYDVQSGHGKGQWRDKPDRMLR